MNKSLSPLPEAYASWRSEIVSLIEHSKLNAMLHVNADMLELYWRIGTDILRKKREAGWGSQVIEHLSADLSKRFPDDKGFSIRNLHNMRRFAENYPDFPILQVPLAELECLPISKHALRDLPHADNSIRIPLDRISWYHHISLLPKIKDRATRGFYILETIRNGWSRDMMLSKINANYLQSVGQAITNFQATLPPPESDLARYSFRDPYNFSFIGSEGIRTEREIENTLASRITSFLMELGQGFAFVGRQFRISVDGDDYYIDILMYHLKLHCYVVVELKAVEFKPEFVSKLNFYISAVDEYIRTPNDNPTIGLLLCRSKSNKKAEFALRGITQPMGIAQYETDRLIHEVAEALPGMNQFNDLDNNTLFDPDTEG